METQGHKFHVFDRVRLVHENCLGTVTNNTIWFGSLPGYGVKVDSGSERRFAEDELEFVASQHDTIALVDKPQMFTDEFISQVIQIIAPRYLWIDIDDPKMLSIEKVRVRFGGKNLDGFEFETDQRGRSIGEALRKVREELREVSGK